MTEETESGPKDTRPLIGRLKNARGKLAIGLIGGAILLGPCATYVSYHKEETVRVRITDKTVKRYEGNDKYLITGIRDDGEVEVFENVDDIFPWHFKWNSSDVQGQLEIGKEYDLDVYGWRWAWNSWYRNIVSAQPVDAQEGGTADELSDRVITANVIAGPEADTFVDIAGERFYSRVDGKNIGEYVHQDR